MGYYSTHAQWDFELLKEFKIWQYFPSKIAIRPFSNIFQRLSVTPKIDQFGRKRYQKKIKDVSYQLLWDFFQKYIFVQERSASESSTIVLRSLGIYLYGVNFRCKCIDIMKGFDAADQRQKEKHTLISILNTYCTVVLYSPIWMNRLLFAFRACSFDHGQNRSKSMFIWNNRETTSGKNYVLKVVPYRLMHVILNNLWNRARLTRFFRFRK